VICPICENENFVKNGIHHGMQRYKCKNCGYQYTKEDSRHSRKEISMAVSLYSFGLSFRTLAKMFEASPNTISLWVKKSSIQKTGSENTIVTDIKDINDAGVDEMRDFVRSKKLSCTFGKHAAAQINDFFKWNTAIE